MTGSEGGYIDARSSRRVSTSSGSDHSSNAPSSSLGPDDEPPRRGEGAGNSAPRRINVGRRTSVKSAGEQASARRAKDVGLTCYSIPRLYDACNQSLGVLRDVPCALHLLLPPFHDRRRLETFHLSEPVHARGTLARAAHPTQRRGLDVDCNFQQQAPTLVSPPRDDWIPSLVPAKVARRSRLRALVWLAPHARGEPHGQPNTGGHACAPGFKP